MLWYVEYISVKLFLKSQKVWNTTYKYSIRNNSNFNNLQGLDLFTWTIYSMENFILRQCQKNELFL